LFVSALLGGNGGPGGSSDWFVIPFESLCRTRLGCIAGGGLFFKVAVVVLGELGTVTKLPIELGVFVLEGNGGRLESGTRFERTLDGAVAAEIGTGLTARAGFT